MKTYQLTDRDFEEFYALMEKVEQDSAAKHGLGPVKDGSYIIDELRRTYRFYFIGWRNRVTSGDSYARGPEPARDDSAKLIRWEIERLRKLLPESDKTSAPTSV